MSPAVFTEGLDPNALRWVRQGPASSISGPQPRTGPFGGGVAGGRSGSAFGALPRPEKFRSGHLPAHAIHVPSSRVSHRDALAAAAEDTSGSDMDVTTESDDDEEEAADVFHGGGRGGARRESGYSLDVDSSPQRIVRPLPAQQQRRGGVVNGAAAVGNGNGNGHHAASANGGGGHGGIPTYRYADPVLGVRKNPLSRPPPPQPQYSSDAYSEVSSSRDDSSSWHRQVRQMPRRPPQQPVGHGRAADFTEDDDDEEGRHRLQDDDDDEGSYSDGSSSEFTSNVVGVRRPPVASAPAAQKATAPAESQCSSAPLRSEPEIENDKGHQGERFSSKPQNYGAPSAPPIHDAGRVVDHSFDGATMRTSASPFRSEIKDSSHAKVEVLHGGVEKTAAGTHTRIASNNGVPASSDAVLCKVPNFHASCQGPWHSLIAYDACIRLCLHSWAKGCMEAPLFLENECALLRSSFGLHHVLLQSEEELLAKQSSQVGNEGSAGKAKRTSGKVKVQVRKVRMGLDAPSGCSFSSLQYPAEKLQTIRYRMSNMQSTLSSGWESLRKIQVTPRLPAQSSFSRQSLAYMHAGSLYIKQVSGLLKTGVTTLRSRSSYELVQETYYCLLKLKSSAEDEGVRMQPGSGETHLFFPESHGDDLIVEVYDSKGKSCGRALAQVANIVEDPNEKLRWLPIFREPEHDLVGRVQMCITYTTSSDENTKYGSVAETVAYDLVLEVAMKVQHFRQRNLLLHGSWKWLLTEFASYYGVSDAYTKLRYLSYIMDVATPTADCLNLVHDFLLPVIMKSRGNNTLSRQENRILGEIGEQIEQTLSLLFENYKSLDESSPSGMIEVFRPATGVPAPALIPAVKLYTLLHDVLSPEAQLKFCSYFQTAAKKRSRRHLAETDEYLTSNCEGSILDGVSWSTAYQKMKALCLNIRNEIYMDIQIHNQHILPSFIDLPNIAASIYSVELATRLRSFLVACPPSGPSPPVAELVIATADFQRDLSSWNLSPVKGGVDAKELFHLYIILWIQDKRLALLESCKLDKVKWAGVRTSHSTTPFVDEMYGRLKDTLNEYEIITCRWPEYTFVLENAIADVEKAVLEALDKQYADVLAPLKDSMAPKKFGLKYVQKLTKRNSVTPYVVPDELGILLNTMKRLLDILRPKIETQLKSWGSCIPDGGNSVAGERLSEVTVLLRAKFRNYLQAVVEKLAENTREQSATKLKRILHDSKDTIMESDIRSRMQPLKDLLVNTINHLHNTFEHHVFVAICRGFWDRMGQDVLSFLENRKENKSWYKASRVTTSVLDDTFASQMQQLLGNSLHDKDVEPPRSVMEVRSILCKDAPKNKDSNFYY